MKVFLSLSTVVGVTSFQRVSNVAPSATRLNAVSFDNFLKPSSRRRPRTTTAVEKFIDAVNTREVDEALDLVDDNVIFEDTDFLSPFEGKDELERVIRLQSVVNSNRIVIDEVVNDEDNDKVGIVFHLENSGGDLRKRGSACFDLSPSTGRIQKAFWVKESNKSGEVNLKVLRAASQVIDTLGLDLGLNDKDTQAKQDNYRTDRNGAFARGILDTFTSKAVTSRPQLSLPEQYFEAWNERDMKKACTLFTDDIEYDDTAFPAPFTGLESLENHLVICAEAFPPTFAFSVDDVIRGDNHMMVRWHVENDGSQLPYTRGSSFYVITRGKISRGIDFLEPAVVKTGGVSLTLKTIQKQLTSEPIRLLPIAVWFLYMYVVFFSDWFFGLPATALEQRTWEEVRDLSLNFFFVSPILNLPFAPVVHPMLEGVFNLLLSSAAMFAGFLSDDRKDKPNLIPMLPIVIGMQFLTSAFLLPYLAFRSNETTEEPITNNNLSAIGQLVESPLLGVLLATVGTGATFWGIFARMSEFGGLGDRFNSFVQLLSIDRVGASFIVDLAIFAAFQGWFVDDDARRRGLDQDSSIVQAAKYVPFFGMAAYMTLRPRLPTNADESIQNY